MKRFAELGLSALLLIVFAAGCKPDPSSGAGETDTLMVGMITDTGTIDDRSFNQGTWEGIRRARDDFNVEIMYVTPAEDATSDYSAAIDDLVGSGYTMIICPGYKFELAIYHAQYKYPSIRFALLDGEPNDGTTFKIAKNSVSIMFAEHETGFLDIVAAAVYDAVKAVLDGNFPGGQQQVVNTENDVAYEPPDLKI